MSTRLPLPDWTRALGRPEATAVLRDSTDDFVVEEVLGFEPSGDGEHTFLFVEKSNRTTDEVAVELARHAGVPRRAVSFAGLKDKRARTRQWFSVQCPPKREIDWHVRFARDVAILECARNRRKLRRGAHRANRFVLTLRDVRDPLDTLPTRLDALAEDGAPNYFGEQRFGRDGQNVEIAQRLFAGARVPRRERSIGLSAARSFLFNEILANRVAAGRWGALIPGDVANLDGRNSVFAVDGVDVELERRCRELDIHPTGPLWGRGGPGSAGDAAALESSLVAGYPALVAGLEAMTELMRRPLRMRVESLQWRRQADTVTLAFDLRRGSFATAVLRELVSAPASR